MASNDIIFMNISKKFRQEGPENIFFKKSSMYFTEGHTDLPREAIGHEGSNCFSKGEGASTSIFKHITICGVRTPCPSSGSAHDIV